MAVPNADLFSGSFGDVNDYNSVILRRKYSAKELRDEYRKMRKEAKERIKELKSSGYEDAQILDNKDYLQKNPSNMTKRELASYLSYTASFLNSKYSTIEGQEERRKGVLQAFYDMGYTNINAKTINSFGKYMDRMRVYVESKVISSDVLLDVYDTAIGTNISMKNVERNIEFYAENIDSIKDLNLNPERKRKYTATELRKKLSKGS